MLDAVETRDKQRFKASEANRGDPIPNFMNIGSIR
jgi:hypothetical protein